MSEVRLVSSLEGPDDAPVLILANPIGTTRAIWDAHARALREDFRLLRFELRGHGVPGAQSDAPPGPYSIAELGTDVLGLMREHGVTTAGYCGISIGGMTGLWLAANAPERISCLVVCCAAITPMPSRQSWLDRAALVRSGGMAAISEMVPPRWFTPDFIARQPAAVAFVVDISGAEDLAAPPWQGAMTAAGIADSRLRVIRGTSHLAPYQTPGPVTAAIRAHLAAS